MQHTSAEYMGANIIKVLTCAGFKRPQTSHSIFADSLTGKVRSAWPKFSRRPIRLEFSFDMQASPVSMTISLTRAQDGE
jgi:hypothetical protein